MKKARFSLLMVLMACMAFIGCEDEGYEPEGGEPNGKVETAGEWSTQWNFDVISSEDTEFTAFASDIAVKLEVDDDAEGLPGIIMVYFIDAGADGSSWDNLTDGSDGGEIALADESTDKNIAAGKIYTVTPNSSAKSYTPGNALKMQLLGKDSEWNDYPSGTKKGIKGKLTLTQGAVTKIINLQE